VILLTYIEEDYLEKEVSVADDSRKDMEYYNKYMETGDKQYFQKLYRGMRGYLNGAINRSAYGSNIPKAVFEVEAAQQMHNALQRYNPNRGVPLQSYVYGAVNDKLKRVNYKYQNMARMPERPIGGVTKVNLFNNEKLFLKDKLNREPSTQELAETLGWPVKEVENMLLENRKDLSLNQELEDLAYFDDFSAEKAELSMHYFDMDPEEQLVYEHIEGLNGKKALLKKNGVDADWEAIARETGMPLSKVQKIRKRLIRRLGS
jgi:DNA-directed RNA polymerase sigma subunit (sigma70/sigma32)